MIFNIIFFVTINLINEIESAILYPESTNVGKFKPISLNPLGSTCGLEFQETLCDNRFQNNKLCSNTTSIILCDQTCPYGTLIPNINKIKQLSLESMEPCEIVKDYGVLLTKSDSTSSYLFDKNNNLCDNDRTRSLWRPFPLSLTADNSSSITNTGFSLSLWFQQYISNNGTLIHIFRDDNTTLLKLIIKSSNQKMYLNYYCNLTKNSLCYLEINTGISFYSKNNTPNFMTIKVYKKQLNIFINEPSSLNELPIFGTFDLEYDLGSALIANAKISNFYIARDFENTMRYFGWIQDLKIFLIPLSNSEILQLFNKRYYVFIQPECRCPNEYPRNEDENSIYCFTNQYDAFSSRNKMPRLNTNTHTIGYINDDDLKTTWISCISTNPITLNLDLQNGVYILQRIEIFFSSMPPTNLLIQRYFNGKWSVIQNYSTICENTDTKCTQLPQKFGKEILGGYTIVWSSKTGIDDLTFYSDRNLLENSKASKLQFTLSGYYPEIRGDIRQLYYAINEIQVKASCDCNGYGSSCSVNKLPNYECNCDNSSKTTGPQCNQCMPLYNDKAYQSRYENPNAVCSLCFCNDRADSCIFDSSINRGFCQNCRNNTFGVNCNDCASNSYYNLTTKSCSSCGCNLDGVSNLTNICDRNQGTCFCKPNVNGTYCEECKDGYYNLTRENPEGCTTCDCNPSGSISIPWTKLNLCDKKTGQCVCKSSFVIGFKCDKCMESMFNLENGCRDLCNCDPYGSTSPVCDQKTGQCRCKPSVSGVRCTQCENGFYNLTSYGCVSKCSCDPQGSLNRTFCDPYTGQCQCKVGYGGINCDICMNGYWRIGIGSECKKCTCNLNGIRNQSNICNPSNGQCFCNDFTEGFACDTCKSGYYGQLNNPNTKCQKCECDSFGTNPSTFKSGLGYICDPVTSQCQCKVNRVGTRCESCTVGYFFLNLDNIDCFECNCDTIGSIPGSVCDKLTGECVCKISNGIGGTRCDICLPEYYNFNRVTGSCSPCGCNEAGSLRQECDQEEGKCFCKLFVTGNKCDGTSNLDKRNPYGCSKTPSKQSPPQFRVLSSSSISITWDPPDYPNGIILYYLVFRNNTLVFNTTERSFRNDGLSPFVVYSFVIQSFNVQGNTTSKPSFVTITYPSQPCCSFQFKIYNIKSTRIDLSWSQPERLNGINLVYIVNAYRRVDINRDISFSNLIEQQNVSVTLELNSLTQTVTSTNFQYTIKNLSPYKQYLISIRACNLDFSQNYLCLNGTAVTDSTSVGTVYLRSFLQFFTSQDKPEFQLSPTVITLNSSYVIIGVLKPLNPNGIVLMYEVLIRRYFNTTANKTDNSQSLELACSIEEWYDPNDRNSAQYFNVPKICLINNLFANTLYAISAISSTVVGRSELSKEIVFNTLEELPVCPVDVKEVYARSDSIFLNWQPSINQSTIEPYWMRCIGGNIRNFTVYKFEKNQFIRIYSGKNNTIELTGFNASTEYQLKIELCNSVGCIADNKLIKIKTTDPPPSEWKNLLPTFRVINSTALYLDWSPYPPGNFTFRLERANASFSYPPTPLESGIRFHGKNYFNFSSSRYFPEGYPFFGLKFFYKTKLDSSLAYYAASSFSQSELTALQFYSGQPWLLSNTQSSISACSIFISSNPTSAPQKFNDQNWYSLKAFRFNSYAYVKSASSITTRNSSDCVNQVITDVNSVYIGGIPLFLYRIASSKSVDSAYKEIQRNTFTGCLKNVSTILEISNSNSSSKANEITFNFNEAEASPGEPVNSNIQNGCPINLESVNNTVQFLGFGYMLTSVSRAMSLVYQSETSLKIEMDIRTEYSHGILFFDFDLNTNQYFILRLVEQNSLEIAYRSTIKYHDPLIEDPTEFTFIEFFINQTYSLGPSVTNGYWYYLRVDVSFVERNLNIYVNNSRVATANLVTRQSVQQNYYDKIIGLEFFVNFYLEPEFYFGGYRSRQTIQTFISSINRLPIKVRQNFIPLFELFIALDYRLYFSGCMKNIKINGFAINYNDPLTSIDYKNIRFDGCPNVNNRNLLSKLDLNATLASVNQSRIEKIYEGNSRFAYDRSFKPFTEYFYRVIASDPFGKSAVSDWFLLRSPEAEPNDYVDLKYLNAKIVSGYQISVVQMSNFCYYCNSTNRMTRVFSGIINNFVLIVKEFNQELNDFVELKNVTFYCETVCFKSLISVPSKDNFAENIFTYDLDLSAEELFIGTKPITKYSLSVKICTGGGCTFSDSVQMVTNEEAPTGVVPPTVREKTASSLRLAWVAPKYSNGNVTGYILRLIDAVNSENVIYFGLNTEYLFANLKSFTTYTFSLEACNRIGCNRSPFVSFTTSEMAPLSVSVPTIVAVNSYSIILKWNRPSGDQLVDGALTNYILYVSQSDLDGIKLTSIDCETTIQQIDNLIPGTEYRVLLAACTNGGCTNSSELKITTVELIPVASDVSITQVAKNSTYLSLIWNKPKAPNGKITKYSLYMNNKLVYEGLLTNYTISNLQPNAYFIFYIIVCNSLGCSEKSKSTVIYTDEAQPEGELILEGNSAGSNQLQLKWYSSSSKPLISNGNIQFSVYATGPFLIELNKTETVNYKKQNKSFIRTDTLNLFNTTIMNTRYGIIDKILPFSVYKLQINASNSKGFILSNSIVLETFKSIPDLVVAPQVVNTRSNSLQIEWYEPILVNSDDRLFYFLLDYRVKHVWNESGPILNPLYEPNIFSVFASKTLTKTFTLTNLKPFTAFSFQVTAINSYGETKSEYSDDYYTREETPRLQDEPTILNYTSTTVSLKWIPPKLPNGIIRNYRLHSLKFTENDLLGKSLTITQNVTLKSTINTYQFENLEPFTYYLFDVESCNTQGCASSYTENSDLKQSKSFIRTDQAAPEQFERPLLESFNSYSVQTSWNQPTRPNGIIKYYILERIDYNPPLTIKIRNIENPDFIKYRKYRFEADKALIKFTDIEQLESCSVYSYRVIAYNDIGNTSTDYVNVTVKPSKPLIVTSPIVNIIDSYTARFEWSSPITYCKIKSYYLNFQSTYHNFRIDVDNSSFAKQSIVVNQFNPFTSYNVSLIACVDVYDDPCTSSILRSFRTPGTVPQNVSAPIARLISNRVVSIEWLEPILKNGISFEYQLIRAQITESLTDTKFDESDLEENSETIYIGKNRFFIDTSVFENEVYVYRVIYGNEFGNSVGGWSNEILVANFTDTPTFQTVDGVKTVFLLFSLKSKPQSPSAVFLEWKTYSTNELLNFLKNLLEKTDLALPNNPSILFSNTKVENITIKIEELDADGNNKTGLVYHYLLSNLSSSISIDKKIITNLNPETSYSFRLNIYLTADITNQTGKIKHLFRFTSEASQTATLSASDAFESSMIAIEDDRNRLKVQYNLSELVRSNYDLIEIKLTQRLDELNSTSVIDNRILRQPAGNLSYGPFEQNTVYSLYISACTRNATIIIKNKRTSLLRENNCIKSYSLFYAITTHAARNLSDLSLTTLDYETIDLKWSNPIYPNDYRLLFEISRRETCNESLILALNSCPAKFNPYSELICCEGKFYVRKSGFECCNNNYLEVPSKSSSYVCCGGAFVTKMTDYECCAGLYYVYVPPGQVCCSNNRQIVDEIIITLGYGDTCCSNMPYSNTEAQQCCNQNIDSTYLINPLSKYAPFSQYLNELFFDNKCLEKQWEPVEAKKCSNYETVYNETNLYLIDSNLSSFTSYDYQICVRNTFDVACNRKVFSSQTEITEPKGFSYFTYKVINENEILLYWSEPQFMNGPLDSYVLYRNEVEIYRGTSLYYIDENYEVLQPFKLFRYEIKVCNSHGCSYNEKTLYASTKEKLPDNFDLPEFKTASHSVEVLWRMPPTMNGVLRNFFIHIKEIDLELSIYFNFKSTKTSDFVSVKNITSSSKYVLYFSADSIYSKFSLFNVTFTDLKPYTVYSFKLSGCNSFGCATASGLFSKEKEKYLSVQTKEFQMFELDDPVIYVIDETSVEIVWQEPKEINGELTAFKLFRNNLFLIELSLNSSELSSNFGFYSYIQKDLIPDTFYSYRIMAMNKNYSILSKEIYVETPSIGFIRQCNYSETSSQKQNASKHYSVMTLLNIVNFNFQVSSSSEITVSYDIIQWRKLITCISLFNYNNMKQTSIDIDSTKSSDDKSAFTIKILLQNNINGLQSLDFPYPDNSNINSLTNYSISGLFAYSNYSLRIAFSTFYPNKQLLTTRPVYLQTFEKEPCCELESPRVIQFPFQKTYSVFSVRFKLPGHPNGFINNFKITRAKLVGAGCDFFENLSTNETIESSKDLNISLSSLFYDTINQELIFKDLDKKISNEFAYFAYKVTVFNLAGSLESSWSIPELNLQFSAPDAPQDSKISNIHSTGFRFKFKEPNNFNGYLSFYTIRILTYFGSTFNFIESEEIILNENINKCKNSSETNLVELAVSGLLPFRTYKVTVYATNHIGFSSRESEEVIVNTFESSPKNLSPFTFRSVLDYDEYPGYSILFKFIDPVSANGLLIKFNLFEYIDQIELISKGDPAIYYDYQLKLIYSGLEREFIYTYLKPFRSYYFLYEVCTASGCTRQTKLTRIVTLEGAPTGQPEPAVNKIQTNLRCFNIEVKEPFEPNGIILFYEVYRIEKIHPLNPFDKEKLIRNLTANSSLISFDDCDLKPNIIYSYKAVAFNIKGNSSSNYSRPVFSSQLLPENFTQINATQVANSIVKIEWKRPSATNGQIVSYNIYRNSEFVTNSTFISNFSQIDDLVFYDNFDFLPKTVYKYELYACNEAGCSNDKSLCIVNITTNDQAPYKVVKPLLLQVSSRNTRVTARNSVFLKSPSTQTIVQYLFYLNESLAYQGSKAEINIENLIPATVYSITVTACTFLNITYGCTKSIDNLLVLTSQEPPAGLNPIQFVDYQFDDYFVNVHLKWKPPIYPYGYLTLVEIKRDNIEIFISKNTSINFYIDSKLDYGKNYTYQLIYFNDAGSVNVTNWHYTTQNFPKLVDKPQCVDKTPSEITISFNDPVFPNGDIQIYEIKYKLKSSFLFNKITLAKKDLKSKRNTIKIDNLKPDTQYEFQVGVCNLRGCTYSTVINDETCRTVETLPEGLDAPECSDLFDFNPARLSLLIKWSMPKNPNGAIIDYTLFRSTIKKAISFDFEAKLNTKNELDKIILYVGKNLSFVDYTVEAYCTYDYLVEVKTKIGSLISPVTRCTTRSVLPMYLSKVGIVDWITNDSISLSLNPPIYLNGMLKQVVLSMITPNGIKEILVYPNLASPINALTAELTAGELLALLKNFKVPNLKPKTNYEIKSKFCNSVGCLVSTDSLSIQTLDNDKITEFNTLILTPNKVRFNWKFKFGLTKPNTPIEYRVKIIGQTKKQDKIIYFGLNDTFEYDRLLASTSYTFELTVLNSITTSALDSKLATLTTPLQKPLFSEMSSIDLIPLNQTLANNSVLIKLDWTNAFLLNGPLLHYNLSINNETIYEGKDTSVVTSVKFEECIYNRYTNSYGYTTHGYFNVLNIRITVSTVYTMKTIQLVDKLLNCSLNLKPVRISNLIAIYYQPWFVFTLFIGGLFGLIIIIVISVYCSSRSKKTKENEEMHKQTAQCALFQHANLIDLERENENLRELLKLSEILDGKDPGEVYSLGNEQTEKIDFEKAKILKDLIDYRNRESLDGSSTEIKDNQNLNTFNAPLKMNSSILSLDSGGLSNNCEFVCRATSDKDSLDELFEPICNSHI